jgi:DNA polymerase-3 subunit gamma/tau
MSYQPLARTYRPKTFEELTGQLAVILALKNSIKLGRIAQCIIFSGVRGVGKTTLARLYAKALDCEHGPVEEPCNVCVSCKAINSGNHEDVLEIDGASNTGVDDVRLLQETLTYVPQRSKYKVYIIDEVHMLSQSAFNALLKTLEEPPSHVVFILATTELNKIPATIASRCQVFHLQKLTQDQIASRLQKILESEKIPFDEDALQIIAKEGNGSMRDAITFMDQLIAMAGGRLDLKKLHEVLAYVPTSTYLDYLRGIFADDLNVVLEQISGWDQKGASFTAAVEEIAKFVRSIAIVKELGADSLDVRMLGIDPQYLPVMSEIALNATGLELNAFFKLILECRDQLDGSFLDRYILENYCLEWRLLKKNLKLPRSVGDSGHQESRDARSSREGINANTLRASSLDKLKVGMSPRETVSERGADDSASSGARETSLLKNYKAAMQPAATPETKKIEPTVLQANINKPEPPCEAAASTETEQASPVAAGVPGFPSSWRELVEKWKQKRPLQARIIEEAKLVSYSAEKIILGVDKSSLVGSNLLQLETQRKLKEHFYAIFGFTGELVVKTVESAPPAVALNSSSNETSANPGAENPGQGKEESLLEIKRKERELYQRKVFEDVRQDIITQKATTLFSSEIESIDLHI